MFRIHPSYTTHYNDHHLAYPVHPLINNAKHCSDQIHSKNENEIMGRSYTHSETFASLNDLGIPTLLVHCSTNTGKCMVQYPEKESAEIEMYPEDKFEQLISSMQKASKKRARSSRKQSKKQRQTKKNK